MDIGKLQKMREDALNNIETEKERLSSIEADILRAKETDKVYKVGYDTGTLYTHIKKGMVDSGVPNDEAAIFTLMCILIRGLV